MLLIPALLPAQEAVKAGRGSYAAFPPTYKSKTPDHGGFQATMIESKELFLDESVKLPDGSRRPIPTNDWWTDLLNNRFSEAMGAFWSYPAMLRTQPQGVVVNYPSYWYENGTEVKSRSSLTVGARNFVADKAIAADWHDWDVEMRLPDRAGESMTATAVHGTPFTWIEYTDNLTPTVSMSAQPTFFDASGNTLAAPGANGRRLGVRVGDDLYGLYLPAGSKPAMVDGQLVIDQAASAKRYIVVGLLKEASDLDDFAPYATSIPRSTKVEWTYDEASATVKTNWTVNAENLDGGAKAPVMQGFLPHAYKHAVARDFAFDGPDYLSPRGTLKMATADNGRFSYSYRFNGVLPYFPAPAAHGTEGADFRPEVMKQLIGQYAEQGAFGGDTYWGGKGLVQMALNMTFAKELGDTEAYETSKAKLRSIFANWFNYTPGEDQYFFAYYPRWGSMVGYDVSYDSDAFNDHHFHYGYFIYAAALLCLEDKGFAADYGEMLTMIAKDYANYDRADSRFPFLRTLDIWAGHSYAGGLGDHGNDNGNGQESSSEAMQSWGGLYLLGVALDNKEMRDAGIFGWTTESNAVAEYWFDRDQIHPERQHNYDYTLYKSPYNTNLTSKGIGWWTWFSGDALWMHSIQWMPVSPCLNYLSKDLDFVKWDYEKMLSATAYKWFDKNTVGAETLDALANQSVGNVVLCYMERYDPVSAAKIFDEAYDRGFPMARDTDTGHISYYAIHSHLTYGDIDFDVYADCPTATAYRRADGSRTYVVYNPGAERDVTFKTAEGAVVKTVRVPAGGFTVFDADPRPDHVAITSSNGLYVPEGSTTDLSAALLDQYGASIDGTTFAWQIQTGAPATLAADGKLTIKADAARGSRFTVTATAQNDMKAEVEFVVNAAPVLKGAIKGVPSYAEVGAPIAASVEAVDQYGNPFEGDIVYEIIRDGKVIDDNPSFTPDRVGRYTVRATGNGAVSEASTLVTPPLPNAALGKSAVSSSEQNVGTATANATDGDPDGKTRWGSVEGSDDEWIYVDLGEEYYVTRVVIDWEAAHAADYDIVVFGEDTGWTDHTGQYAGKTLTVKKPVDDNAAVVSVRGLSKQGVNETVVGARGRYVMARCVRRGSVYGYSLYELKVHGIAASAKPTDVIGLSLSAPEVMDEGAVAELSAKSMTLAGEMTPTTVEWSSSIEAEFDGDRFTPRAYGLATLTATDASGLSSEAKVLVNESIKLASVTITPANSQIIIGDQARLEIKGVNQFGGAFEINPSTVKPVITDASGAPVDPAVASLDLSTGIFSATRTGVYTVAFGDLGKATVKVAEVAGTNLALNKTASATSGIASLAVDGDRETRWESAFADGEAITVDLENYFVINRVDIIWEAAYAKAYHIQTSVDGENWTTVFVNDNGKGSPGKAPESLAMADVPARYVRLVCDERFMPAYGNSLYEMEVYGSARYAVDHSDATAPAIEVNSLTQADGTVNVAVTGTDASGYVFYEARVVDGAGRIVGASSAYGLSGAAVGMAVGPMTHGVNYTVEIIARDPMGNTTTVEKSITAVIDVEGKNLALRRPVVSTETANADNSAKKAVDGDYSTRWESKHQDDNASIEVELDNIYEIHAVKLYSTDGAIPSVFDIEVSTDGTAYEKLATEARWSFDDKFEGKGSGVELYFNLGRAGLTEAKYVKIVPRQRAMPQYGSSIGELEVYGGYGDSFATGIEDAIIDPDAEPVYYNLQGLRVVNPSDGQLYIVVRGASSAKEIYRASAR